MTLDDPTFPEEAPSPVALEPWRAQAAHWLRSRAMELDCPAPWDEGCIRLHDLRVLILGEAADDLEAGL